jgi:hypothetical protein
MMSDSKEVPSDVDGASCPSRCSALDDAAKALIEVIELLEPFEKDIRQRILKSAKVFLVDAFND